MKLSDYTLHIPSEVVERLLKVHRCTTCPVCLTWSPNVCPIVWAIVIELNVPRTERTYHDRPD